MGGGEGWDYIVLEEGRTVKSASVKCSECSAVRSEVRWNAS